MNKVKGDLIAMALDGKFDVIAHGCNCFCKQESGIAKGMAHYFDTNNENWYELEHPNLKGQINKLGTIEYAQHYQTLNDDIETIEIPGGLFVVNMYTQYRYGRNHADGDNDPYDAYAIILCLMKLNHTFKGKKVGLPYIGCGLASPPELREARKSEVEFLIESYMEDCEVTLIEYNK